MMQPYNQLLIERLALLANSEKAVGMKAYMKNRFEFFGITTPERRAVLKGHDRQYKIQENEQLQSITQELWQQPQRELQYCAIDLLLSYHSLWHQDTIILIAKLITNKSWWDSVDPLAYDCAGRYFSQFPSVISNVTAQWNTSENIWLQRSSLLYQKSYKKSTDTTLLSQYIINLAGSKEFFVQKAIGWILREYAKTDEAWVKNFVSKNKIAPLSRREALKHL